MPKPLEFPHAVAALFDRSEGLVTEVWWSFFHSLNLDLTKQATKVLAYEYTTVKGKPRTMPLPFKHPLFDVAINALRTASIPLNTDRFRAALKAIDYNFVAGNIYFSKGFVPNIAKTAFGGEKWFKGANGPEPGIIEITQVKYCPMNREMILL